MSVDERRRTSRPSIGEVVGAPGPHPEHADSLRLFGQFIGSWDLVSTQFTPDGRSRSYRGEWHFFWALEGRAVQDVILSPGREERDASRWKAGEYGTTIRYYRPDSDSWDVTYVSPPNDQVHRLIARAEDGRIVLRGAAPDGRPEVWTFYDITADRCRWRGQISSDGGQTWFTDEEMALTRR